MTVDGLLFHNQIREGLPTICSEDLPRVTLRTFNIKRSYFQKGPPASAQRRTERSKSTETVSSSGGVTLMVAESAVKAVAGNWSRTLTPATPQPLSPPQSYWGSTMMSLVVTSCFPLKMRHWKVFQKP